MLCPITSRTRNYPFEIEVVSDCNISGVVMSDQVKSTDWRARYARYAGKASPNVVDEVIAQIAALLVI